MNKKFKKNLQEMLADKSSGSSRPDSELRKIIAFGVMGEGGEDYYLFLYRDFYRNSAYYGAIIFLNKPDPLENPVTVIGLEQNGKRHVRNVYIHAALHFLTTNGQDTMTVSGNAAAVFQGAKEIINEYLGQIRPTVDKLEEFAVEIHRQEIQFQEISPKAQDRPSESRFLKRNLIRLREEETGAAGTVETGKIKAKLGLCLVSRHVDLSGERQHVFQPVILPLTAEGHMGKPQKPAKTGELDSSFTWVEAAEILEDFFAFYRHLESETTTPRLKAVVLNQVFFQRLAEEIFAMPPAHVFCQVDNAKEYQPLNTLKFNKVGVRLAPVLKKEGVYRFYLTFHSKEGVSLDVRDNYEIILSRKNAYVLCSLTPDDRWFLVPDAAAAAETPGMLRDFYRFFTFIAAQEEFYINESDLVLPALQRLESPYLAVQAQPLKKYRLRFLPTPVLNLFPPDKEAETLQRLEIQFDYQEAVRGFIRQHPDKIACTYDRVEEFESLCLEILKSDPLLSPQMDFNNEKRAVYHYYYFKEDDLLTWLLERGRKYLEKGFKIYSIKRKRFIGNAGSSLQFRIKSDIDWLEYKPYIIDALTGAQTEIDMDLFDPQQDMVVDKKGMLHLVTPGEIEKLARLARFAEPHGDCFWVPSRNYILIRHLYDKKMEEMPEVKGILAAEEKLKSFEQIPDYSLSTQFNGQLRTYQSHGFKWLYFLQDYRFSGCLADDMGLGKTVQTLALLQTLKDHQRLHTSLLVVPVSAIPNWEAEMRRFTPALTYHRHIGPARDKTTDGWTEKDLVITSYATLRNDIEMIKEFTFDYIILDESQNIKNPSSQVSKAVKILNAGNRLALSGTPIENNTMELWSLFDFLMPGFLGSYRWFDRQFAQGIEKGEDPEKAPLLKKMIYPFILRRKKQEVETELPDKIEIVSSLQMEEEQAKVYADTALFYRDVLDKTIDEKGVAGASIKILEGMLRLRQICLFPGLVEEKFNDIPSVKFLHLTELLEDILAENHKVLVFSQFVQVLQHIKNHCDDRQMVYSYLDGSVDIKAREQAVKTFQEDENTRVFLLSLKAGGVALNLTAADYVIIFDPWWNPAVEAQAIDRSHRIGQTKNVMVYRLVVKDTIEEKMLELQEKKKALVENLIASDIQAFKKLKKEDILDLFK